MNRVATKRRKARSEALLKDEQTEKLLAIGTYFQQIREHQHQSLDHIAQATKIQPRILRAIETADLKELPEPVFIRSYIKLFAQALGLNGPEFANAFPVEPMKPVVTSSWWLTLPQWQLRPLHLYGLYMVIIFIAINGLSYVVRDPSLPDIVEVSSPAAENPSTQSSGQGSGKLSGLPVPPTTTSLSASQGSSPQDPQASPQVVASPLASSTIPLPHSRFGSITLTDQLAFLDSPKVDQSKPVRVIVHFKEQSWVRVRADDNTLFEGVLAEGTERSWSADRTITIRSGNAGGVLVSANESPLKPMGEVGAVEEISITPDVANASSGMPSPKEVSRQSVSIPNSQNQ